MPERHMAGVLNPVREGWERKSDLSTEYNPETIKVIDDIGLRCATWFYALIFVSTFNSHKSMW